MSNSLLTAAFNAVVRPCAAKLVLLSLADRADNGGTCWSSNRDLRARTNLSERTIQSATRQLHRNGHLTVHQNAGPKGANRFVVHPRISCEGAISAEGQSTTPNPAILAPPPPQFTTLPPAIPADEPSINPPLNPMNLPGVSRGDLKPQTLSLGLPDTSLAPEERSALKPKTVDSSFDRFWSIYPRKVDKESTQKAWRKIKPTEVELILPDIARRTPDWQKEPKFIPYPSTYLNGRRWEDETSVTTATRTPRRKGF